MSAIANDLPRRAAALGERVRFLSTRLASVFLLGGIMAYYPFDDMLDRWGTPWGGDFPMFYVAGQTAARGEWDVLYNDAAQQQRLHALLPGLASDYTLPYRYPPFVAALLAPLASLPYAAALAAFVSLACLAWAAAARLLVRSADLVTATRPNAYWLAAGFPVAWEVVLGGQASHFALLFAAAGMVLLRRQQPLLAGLVLGCAIYKPNVLGLFLIGCALRYPRCLIGMAITCGLAATISLGAVGFEGLQEYADYASQLAVSQWRQETRPFKVHGLGSWVALLAPGNERRMLLVVGLAATGCVVWRWRIASDQAASFPHYTSLLLLINALANPYVPIYDLVLLLPVAVVMLARASAAEASNREYYYCATALMLLLFGPHLSQMTVQGYGWPQWFPVALLAVTVLLARQGPDYRRPLVPSPQPAAA